MMETVSDAILQNLIAAFLKSVSRPVGGILGQDTQAQAVIDGLGLSGAAFITNRNEELYELDLKDLVVPNHIERQRFSMVPAGQVERHILK